MSDAGMGSKMNSGLCDAGSRVPSACTTGWARTSSSLSSRSRYIASLWKENVDRSTVGSTPQWACWRTDLLTLSRRSSTLDTPVVSTSGSVTPSSRILSVRAGLRTTSSSPMVSVGVPLGPDGWSSTGTSSSGLDIDVPSTSSQFSMPSATYRTVRPRSRYSALAFRMRFRSAVPSCKRA